MKKFFVPLFFFLFLSCSNEGFESTIAASAQKEGYCYIVEKDICYKNISKKLCKDMGGESKACAPSIPGEGDSSSSEEASSSSGYEGSSSSRNSSSSSLSSSAGNNDSSSSGTVVESSSSVAAVDGSSSSVADVPSSSSVDDVSSSSTDSPSSSSNPPPEPPVWSDCSIPEYVGRNEPIANLKFISIVNNNGRCGVITYKLNGTGQNVTDLNYNNNMVGTSQTLNITASTMCSGGITLSSKACSKSVTVANYEKFAASNTDTYLQAGKTIVEVGGVTATMFGCQAEAPPGNNNEPNPNPNPFEGRTSFILDGVTASVTTNVWWVKTPITNNRMLFESNNPSSNPSDPVLRRYRCRIE